MNRVDRRSGPDVWERSLRYLALAGWAVLAVSFLIYGRAKPQPETFFDRYYGISLRLCWDMAWVRPLLWSLLTGLVIAISGLVVNMRRHRRRTDEWRISLLLLSLCCVAGIVAFLRIFR